MANDMNDLGNFGNEDRKQEVLPTVWTPWLVQSMTTPLGDLLFAGHIHNNTAGASNRVLGQYAIVYLTAGGGNYRDDNGTNRRVSAGDALILLPEVRHSYGAGTGDNWDEIHVVFGGKVFDLWRESRLIDPLRPVVRLTPIEDWLARFEDVIRCSPAATAADRMAMLSRFLSLFTDVLAAQPQTETTAVSPAWAAYAETLLGSNLEREIRPADVAEDVHLSYESFRKQFERHAGISPAQFRLHKRLDAARSLLRYTEMTMRQIAETLGFSDEFHLSNRFRQHTGIRPSEYRRQCRRQPNE